MAKEAVALIVKDGYGNILIGLANVREGKYFSGKWHLPGETVQTGESLEQAAARGMHEEVGLYILALKQITQNFSPDAHVTWLECQSTSTQLTPASDLADAKWVPLDQVVNNVDESSFTIWPDEVKKYFGLID